MLLKKIFINFNLDSVVRVFNRTPRVVFWHGVDVEPHPAIEAESITFESFRKQIEYLAKNYEIISTKQFYERYTSNDFNGREVVLHFDDGYRNNLNVVAPYLISKKIPFTVFVSTDYIYEKKLFPTSLARVLILSDVISRLSIPSLGIYDVHMTDMNIRQEMCSNFIAAIKRMNLEDVGTAIAELKSNVSNEDLLFAMDKYSSTAPMNWNELRYLSSKGVTIGSHCQDHICCHENQSIQEVQAQIFNSRIIIEKELGVSCEYFAYPNGDYTECSDNLVLKAGYKLGFSTKKNKIYPGKNQASIPRISAPRDFDSFKMIMSVYPRLFPQ